jgi:methionine synthase I (cobalamin-dependent)
MHPLIGQLTAGAPVVTDGAWGTQLLARGLPAGACGDEWNLSHPERVEEVARAYADAGSRVLLTNTFRANRLALEAHGLADRVAEINRAGVAISRRAAGDRARVFASIGPSGKQLLAGEVRPDELRQAFAEQAQALAAGGADALVIETMGDLNEATIALAAARATGLPVVACMAFVMGPARDRTTAGVTPEQAAEALAAAGADVVGANCGEGVAAHVAVCRRLRAATDRPVWVKANAGLPRVVGGKLVYPTTAREFAGFGPALHAAGASFIGGCCGTGPEFIRALCQALSV